MREPAFQARPAATFNVIMRGLNDLGFFFDPIATQSEVQVFGPNNMRTFTNIEFGDRSDERLNVPTVIVASVSSIATWKDTSSIA